MPASPAAGAVRFELQGDDLNAVYRRLRQTDPKLAAAIRKGIKNAAQPVVDEVKREAEAQGLHRAATATSVGFSSSAIRGITATVKTDHKAAPMARPLEYGSQGARGRFNRHRVFGHDVYVNQPLRPYFWSAIARSSPLIAQRIEAAVEAALR